LGLSWTIVLIFTSAFPAGAAEPEEPSLAEMAVVVGSSPEVFQAEQGTIPELEIAVDLPFDLRDATSTSLLMQSTQKIIEATEIEVPPGSHPLRLITLVEETLKMNLVLRGSRLDPEIAETEIDDRLAAFDPVGFAHVTVSKTNSPAVGFLATGQLPDTGDGGVGPTPTPVPITVGRSWSSYKGIGDTQTGEPGLGATQKFTSGLEATLQLIYGRSDTSTDFFQPFGANYNTDVVLDVVQPLLRGYGPTVNLAPVRIAYNDQRISEEYLRQITNEIIATAHNLYWGLVFARVNLAINQQSLALAADLLRENRIRFKYGDLIAVEVYEAEAGVKEREQKVIQAENELANGVDDIREILAANRNYENWEAPLVPVDPAIFHPVSVEENLSLMIALEKNPDIRIAKLSLKNSNENQILTRDAFKPQLDLFAQARESGLGRTWGESHDELTSGDYTSWKVGLEYSMPIKRRREKANMRAADLQTNQAKLSLDDMEQKVLYDHREAIRNIETLVRQVEASNATVRAESNRLEKQRISHEQGITTSHDLLNVQEDYAQAQVIEISAITQYYMALVELERIRGTLLDSLGFEFVKMGSE
jgi:outer membrane protein TolC